MQEVHAGLIGPDVTELREAGDLHPSSITSVTTLQSRDIFITRTSGRSAPIVLVPGFDKSKIEECDKH